MEHIEVAQKHTVDRYLLGELTEDECEAFEEHYFSCMSCAEEVKQAAAFVDNARAVLASIEPGRAPHASTSNSYRPALAWALVASNLLFVGAGVVGLGKYQEAVAPHAVAERVELAATHGADHASISRKAAEAVLTIKEEWPEKYDHYVCEFEGKRVAGKFDRGKGPFQISIHPAQYKAGMYHVTMYGVRGASEDPGPAVSNPVVEITD